MKKITAAFICFFAGAAFFLCAPGSAIYARQEQHPVVVLRAEGTIDPALARYLARGLDEARQRQASVVILRINTEGGLDRSIRRMIQTILDSPVPVVVYVSPEGARAASTGAFIAAAAHGSAMAPGTMIGAACAADPADESDDKLSMARLKLTNDAAAYLRSVAQDHGRNIEWVETAVRQGRVITAQEAFKQNAVDYLAPDLEDLLGQINGREVKTVFGAVTIDTEDQPRLFLGISHVENFLHRIMRPNLAYALLLFGIYAIVFELSTAGFGLPGVAGAVALVLSLVMLETLAVYWLGLGLIAFSMALFITDIKLAGRGVFSLAGLILFVIGSLFLFPGADVTGVYLSPPLVIGASAFTALFFLFVVGAGIRSLKNRAIAGLMALVGQEGSVETDLNPQGIVRVHGEQWQARSTQPLWKGSRVKIIRADGLVLWVEPILDK